ncbi:hypothetical protein ACFLYJ_01335 [Candidatus Cloacimonadota bacterium]
MTNSKIDYKCLPYKRKGFYWLITLPYLTVFTITAFYLGKFNIVLSSIYILFYFLSVILHGYVCSFNDCPYKGSICPGAFGWFPVGKVAYIVEKLKFKKSEQLINMFFLIIMLCLLGILTLPLYWFSKSGIGFSIGYFGFILIHFTAFVLIICPKCANRDQCPTAKLSNSLHKMLLNNDIGENP